MRVKCGQIKKKPNWEFFLLNKNAYYMHRIAYHCIKLQNAYFVAYLTRIFSKIYPHIYVHILKIKLHKIAYPDNNK